MEKDTMNRIKKVIIISLWVVWLPGSAQQSSYPKGYFRNPLSIPMQLVANFGEIRSNHWHMGLDIRTNQRVNLPVYAAAAGYIARVVVEPNGFGQAIYINHPGGYTTLYAHLNEFFPALAQHIKATQYKQQSWKADITLPSFLFPVNKGDFIALSGSTGGSQGPHVHFEIRETKTEKCLNPLLFGFPIADAVPPAVYRLGMYDRNKSVYHQTPRILPVKKTGSTYTLASVLKTGSDKISFAVGAVDRFTGSANPNGIYAASVFLDGRLQSEFVLDKISYDDTRYINAQIDYRYKYSGGSHVQHISPLPGDFSSIYRTYVPDGIIRLQDTALHRIRMEVKDAHLNTSVIEFSIQYQPGSSKTSDYGANNLLPGNVNVFETDNFELFTSEYTLYDTVQASHLGKEEAASKAVSPLYTFLSAAIPAHDSIRIRLKPDKEIAEEDKNRIVIKNVAGSKTVVEKAQWQGQWLAAKFRQFGTYQAFVDDEPPTINVPPADLTRASRIVFTPADNFKTIKSFRAELNGQWLMFSNDKGRSWIYRFDEHFPAGEHELTVTVTDEAGNTTTKSWKLKR